MKGALHNFSSVGRFFSYQAAKIKHALDRPELYAYLEQIKLPCAYLEASSSTPLVAANTHIAENWARINTASSAYYYEVQNCNNAPSFVSFNRGDFFFVLHEGNHMTAFLHQQPLSPAVVANLSEEQQVRLKQEWQLFEQALPELKKGVGKAPVKTGLGKFW